MNNQVIDLIYWRNLASTYLAGSTVEFVRSDLVLFSNALMPPGKVITTWYANTNYQADRFSPQLPLLEPRKKYQLVLRAASQPQASLYLRLDFYDALGQLCYQKFIKGSKGTFTYPQQAVDYRVSLINAGCQQVEFHRLELASAKTELKNNDDFILTEMINASFQQKTLNLLWLEPDNQINLQKDPAFSSKTDWVILATTLSQATGFLAEPLQKRLQDYWQRFAKLIFWGTGHWSNLAGCYYGQQFAGSRVKVSAAIEPKEFQQLTKEKWPAVERYHLADLTAPIILVDHKKDFLLVNEDQDHD
ncbi:accessory Sec system protein Asp3 [Liquorilactobacillus sicerae]|uniref:accessory Sec system protein Asp3 n=1 Tax=Liquorilactobacillus sicerae TaxID=1416943 RepID=UPI002480596B|nr:accessory Sec system protein Asp3 [Liquorilactobacillus sicerae]